METYTMARLASKGLLFRLVEDLIEQFLPRDAMHARYNQWACVCLSVCLSQVGVLLKWLDGSSWFFAMEAFFDQSYTVF